MEGFLLDDKTGVGGERCELFSSYHGTKVSECQMLNSSTFYMNFPANFQSPRGGFLPVPVSLIVRCFK